MKYCKKCETDKQDNEYRSSNTTKDGLFGFCRNCQDKVNKDLYEKKKEQRIKQVTKWNNLEENKEKVKEYKRDWVAKNK